MLRGTEKEREVKNAELRHEIDYRAAGDDGRINNAHTHALQEVALVSKLRVGIDRDCKLTIASCFYEFLELERTHVKRIIFVYYVGELDIHDCGSRDNGKNSEKETYR